MKLLLLQPRLKAFGASSNLRTIEELISGFDGSFTRDDIILLPEHFTSRASVEEYEDFVRRLATSTGCTVVGGSHHRKVRSKRLNYGSAIDRDGRIIGEYTKIRPYFNEQKHISPGDSFGEFLVGDWNILVLICADFWYSDLILTARTQPDLILVPALSVSRKKDPSYSRALWRHLAISRAYEFGACIGISDWHEDSHLPKYRTCGVGGLADPSVLRSDRFYTGIEGGELALFEPDLAALRHFREDRRERGFFWKKG